MATFQWREATITDICEWFQGKRVVDDAPDVAPYPEDARDPTGILLSDGSAVVTSSEWTGPYSELTPDVNGETPRFWIGTPTETTR